MTDQSSDDEADTSSGDIHTEISTKVSHEDQGTVYAVQTVKQGVRRVDWKIGHLDGTFAEGAEYYYKGDVFHAGALTQLPENAPRGRYKDDTFHELIDSDSSIEDGKLTETFVFDLDGVDTAEWAKEYLGANCLQKNCLMNGGSTRNHDMRTNKYEPPSTLLSYLSEEND